MKIMNTVFTDHLGVETRSSFQSQCHAIETLAMQPRRAAEEPNSVGAPRAVAGAGCMLDGVAIPGQPELVNVSASNSVSILMHAQTVSPSPVSQSW